MICQVAVAECWLSQASRYAFTRLIVVIRYGIR